MSGLETVQAGRVLSQPLKVASVSGGKAMIEADHAAGCGGCVVSTGCAAKALIEISRARKAEKLALEAAELKAGDSVEVSMPSGAFLAASVLAFLTPAIALVVTVLFALIQGYSNAATALLCLPVLVISLWPLARAERRGRLLASLQIERVLPSDPS